MHHLRKSRRRRANPPKGKPGERLQRGGAWFPIGRRKGIFSSDFRTVERLVLRAPRSARWSSRFSVPRVLDGLLREILLRRHMAAVVQLERFEEVGAVFLEVLVGEGAVLGFLSRGRV